MSGTCHYHPVRPGIGVCVECRQVVCAECSTQFEGINRCASCLARLGKREAAGAAKAEWALANVLTLLLVFAVLFGGVSWAASVLAP